LSFQIISPFVFLHFPFSRLAAAFVSIPKQRESEATVSAPLITDEVLVDSVYFSYPTASLRRNRLKQRPNKIEEEEEKKKKKKGNQAVANSLHLLPLHCSWSCLTTAGYKPLRE